MSDSSIETGSESVFASQVKDLFRNLMVTSISSVVISTFLVWILWPVASSFVLLSWYLYNSVLALLLVLLAYRYKRDGQKGHSSKFWLYAYVIGTLLSGLGWGCTIIFIVPIESTYYLLTTVILMFGLVTGSATSMSSLRYGFTTFSIPALLPSAFYLVIVEAPYTLVIGGSIYLFLVIISFVALRMHTVILYSIRQQFEYGKTLVKIEHENEELKLKNSRLEKKIEEDSRYISRLKSALKNKAIESSISQRKTDINLKKDKFRLLIDKLDGGVWDFNTKTGDMNFSDDWLKMLGYSNTDETNTFDFWHAIVHPDDVQEWTNKLDSYLEGKTSVFSSSHRLKNKSGQWVWVMARAQGVAWDNYGKMLSVVGIEINISDSTDGITNMLSVLNFNEEKWLYTEGSFKDRFNHAIQTAELEEIEHAFCHIKISDPANFSEMDEPLIEVLLNQIGRNLFEGCRLGDAIVRLEKDSFGLLIEYCSLENAWARAKSLKETIKTQQFSFKGMLYQVDVCIGITPVTGGGLKVQDFFEDAVTACNKAEIKASGGIYIYQKTNENLWQEFFEKQANSLIKLAVQNKNFQIKMNPVKSIAPNMSHEENLFISEIMLPSQSNNSVFDDDILALVENNDLRTDIYCCAIEMFVGWLTNKSEQLNALNVYIFKCPDQLIINKIFVSRLQVLLENQSFTSHIPCFGISENIFINDARAVSEFIEMLKPTGARISITDFGLNSLSYDLMKQFPIDYLGLENSLINNIDVDESCMVTIKYISEMMRLRGLKTIAENIHTIKTLEALSETKIDYLYGNVIERNNPIII